MAEHPPLPPRAPHIAKDKVGVGAPSPDEWNTLDLPPAFARYAEAKGEAIRARWLGWSAEHFKRMQMRATYLSMDHLRRGRGDEGPCLCCECDPDLWKLWPAEFHENAPPLPLSFTMRLFDAEGEPLVPGDPARMPVEIMLLAGGRCMAWTRDAHETEHVSLGDLCDVYGLVEESVRALSWMR